MDEDGNVTNDNLTWAQAQRLVEVEDDQSNRIYRLSIFEVRSFKFIVLISQSPSIKGLGGRINRKS